MTENEKPTASVISNVADTDTFCELTFGTGYVSGEANAKSSEDCHFSKSLNSSLQKDIEKVLTIFMLNFIWCAIKCTGCYFAYQANIIKI